MTTPPLIAPDATPAHVPARDWNYARKLWSWFLAPPPSLMPDEWAEKEPVNFNYSQSLRGPCDFTGRSYLRRPIRDAANPEVRKQKKIFGRGNGKTLIGEVKKCYKLKFAPGTRGLSVWPAAAGEGSSSDYVNSRLSKTIKATKCLNDLIPAGVQERFVINGKKVVLNGSYYGFIGSNSGSKGVGNRLNDIDFDEIEKYPHTLKNEGSIIDLAEGATKGVAEFQIDYSSTPTIEEGLMWKAIQQSNLHLYFLPCPHCSSLGKKTFGLNASEALSPDHALLINSILHRKKNSAEEEEDRAALALREKFKGWFIILFSERYAAGYPSRFISSDASLNGQEIPFAEVQFRYGEGGSDKNPVNDAKAKDGTWNRERIMDNAHIVCPHCKKAIRDYDPKTQQIEAAQKIWMDANGAWVCVRPGEPGDIGYMINSLYAPVINKEATWGGYSMEFISAIEKGSEAVRTFINAILAGVYASQENRTEITLATTPLAQPDWVPLLTADFHKNHPYIWFVVRKWCAFKLLPPFEISNGLPDFLPLLELPENADAMATCLKLIGCAAAANVREARYAPGWLTIAELMRFKSGEGRSPLIDFLIAQKITGEKLVKLYRETAKGNTMDFRKAIYELIAKHEGTAARVPRGGDSELIACGYLETSGTRLWEDLREIETEFKVGHGLTIDKRCTAVDTGYAEEFHREVLQECYNRAEHFKWYDPMSKNAPPVFHGFWRAGEPASPAQHKFCLPCPADGWIGLKGIPTNRPLGDGKINYEIAVRVEDPFYGTPEAGTKMIEVMQIPSGLFWRKKDDLRQARTVNAYGISPQVSFWPKHYQPDGQRTDDSPFKLAEYQRHLSEQFYDEEKRQVLPRHGKGGSQNRRHPYHLDDCETYQVALATHHQFFESGKKK